MSGKTKMLEILSRTRSILWTLGLYHGKQFPKYALFEAKCVVTIGLCVLFLSSILMKILLSKPDIAMLSKLVSCCIANFWILLRILLYVGSLPKQRALDDLLQDDIFNMQNRGQMRLISARKEKQKYLVTGFMGFYAVFITIFLLINFASNTNINIPIWTPFDGKKEDVIITIFEDFSFFVIGIAYTIMDCDFIGFISIVTIQMRILKDNLEHATDRDPEGDSIKQERKVQERLRTCIVHHNAIMDLALKVEDLFEPTLICQIVFAVLQICFFAVVVAVVTDRAQLLFWVITFVAIVVQIMVSCWCGQALITESSGIIEACYMSEWYICTPSTRKMYFIIMEQAKRSIALKGGPFFTLSYDTFVNILRSAYSYYTVFSQIYKK